NALLLLRLVIFGDLVPVHHVPEGLEIFGPAILVLEIVGMLPDVAAEKRLAFDAADSFAHQGVILVSGRNELDFAMVDDQPGPTAAEPAHAGGLELFFEGVETAEGALDIFSQFAGRGAARLGRKNLPKHR